MNEFFLYRLFECATVVFETFIIRQYLGMFFERRSQGRLYILGYIVFGLGLAAASLFLSKPIILLLSTSVGIYALVHIFYKSAFWERLFPVFFFAITAIATEVICTRIVLFFQETSLDSIKEYGLPRIFYIVISKLVQLFFIRLLQIYLKRKDKPDGGIDIRQILPLLMCQVFSISLSYYVFMIGYSVYEHLNLEIFFSMLGIMYINLIVFWYFDSIKAAYEYKNQMEAAEITQSRQMQYYKTLEEHQEETDALWHDMKKHIETIKTMVQNGSREESEQYLLDLDRQMDEIPPIIRTKHGMANALITNATRKAKKANIEMRTTIKLEEDISISPADLCALLGNMLENAEEACLLMPEGSKKHIDLNLIQTGLILLIEVKNTYDRSAEKPIRPGKHGYGLKNIHRVVRKYDGDIDISGDNGVYSVSVMIS